MTAFERMCLRALCGALVWVASAGCGTPNNHKFGEVCSPFAVGSNPGGDGGTSGDCKVGLVCACSQATQGCFCSTLCQSGDAGLCQVGYSCIDARDVNNNSTNGYCLPGDGGA